jgi:bifunctional DNA-binding transcriptional regulator/antitoxin component of YhaV-PrlF toxin-antitoxin module
MSSKPMTITVANEFQRMFPPGVRRMAGFKAGDQVEVKGMDGLVDAANLCNCLRQASWPFIDL